MNEEQKQLILEAEQRYEEELRSFIKFRINTKGAETINKDWIVGFVEGMIFTRREELALLTILKGKDWLDNMVENLMKDIEGIKTALTREGE